MSDICIRIKRNKRKFLYLAGIIGSGYAIYKITNFVQNCTNKYQSNKNLTFKIQKAQYFQATIINSLDTIKSILQNLEHEIESSVDLEHVATTLGANVNKSSQSGETVKQQHAVLSADEKLELWKKFKVICFTKLTLLIYCWSFISISISIQMSILAGNLFTTRNVYSPNVNMFLSFYELIFPPRNKKLLDDKFQMNFINFTLKQIQLQIGTWANLIEKVSNKVIGSISLKTTFASDDIFKVLRQIQDSVHNDILEMFLHDIQLQTGNRLVEANVFELFANVFESSGIGHVDSLIYQLSNQVGLLLNRKMKSFPLVVGETETVVKAPLAKLLPFLWISFINGDNRMFNCVRDFSRIPEFRFMLYNSYENAMDSFGQ